jgi:hypothetical protein
MERLRQSIERKEVYEYMIGRNGYSYPNPYADMPTNPHDVFDSFKAMYSQSKAISVWKTCLENVVRMSADTEYSWLSLYYMVAYMRFEARDKQDVPPSADYINMVVENIKMQKETLSASKRWVGNDYEDGLWGDVQRMIGNIEEEFQRIL